METEFVPCLVCAKIFFSAMAVLFLPIASFGIALLMNPDKRMSSRVMWASIICSGPLGWAVAYLVNKSDRA